MFILTWLTGLLRHRAARLTGSVLGVAMTVALLGSLGVFFAASKAQMTRQALAGVVVDWQVQLAPGAAAASAGRVIAGAPGVVKSLPVGYASTTGLTATAGDTTQVTGPGKVLGLPPGYSAAFPGEIRYLVGARSGVLLAQQTAANLHASVGTVVAIGRKGLPPAKVVVRGIVDLPAADSMFQAVGTPLASHCKHRQTMWSCCPRLSGSATSPSSGTPSQARCTSSITLPFPRGSRLIRRPPSPTSRRARRTWRSGWQAPGRSATTWPPSLTPPGRTRCTRSCCSCSSACLAQCSPRF